MPATFVLAPRVAAPAPMPAPAPQAPVRPPAAHPFAELLRQNRLPTIQAQPAPAPAPSADPAPADESAPTPEPSRPAGPRAKARTSNTDGGGARSGHVSSTTPTESQAAKPAGASDDAAPGTSTDTTMAQWLADLRPLPADRTAAGGPSGETAEASPSEADTGQAGGVRGRPVEARDPNLGDPVDHEAGDEQLLREGKDFRAALSAEPSGALAAGVTPGATAKGPRGVDTAPGAPAVAALPQATPLAPGSSAAPVSVALPVPLDAPDFAQALGVQVSVLAKNGVHKAELHLNPADMGPVSVQIVMDGTQARIDFGADLAHTRRAIEAGIPELAGALRDAGLTLSGGGVSEHSRSREESDPGTGQGPREPRHALEREAPQRVQARIAVPGRVDLYA